MDDDIYVIVDNLVKLLSKMDPKTEARYIGKPLTCVVSSCVLNTVNTSLLQSNSYPSLIEFDSIMCGFNCLPVG